MNFLRLLTKRAHQNITFSCYKERQNDCTLKLLGENEKEFKSSEQKQLSFVPIADSKVSSIQILFSTIVVYKNDKKRKYLYRTNPSTAFQLYFEELNLFITVLCS